MSDRQPIFERNLMNTLPFSTVEEARENLDLLKRTLEYFSIESRSPKTGAEKLLGLQQTQRIVSNILGFARWEDLTACLEMGGMRVVYFDKSVVGSEAKRDFVNKFFLALNTRSSLERVDRALFFSGFGCEYEKRSVPRMLLDDKLINKIEKLWKVFDIQIVHSYHTRYNQNRTQYENDLLNWQYNYSIAEALETGLPKKPRKKKSQ